jgi:cardiolipin synthase (CMP-forming)
MVENVSLRRGTPPTAASNTPPAARYTQERMPRWVNLANVLTLARFVLVPFVILAILEANHGRALLLFACAAVTDGLDGLAARASGCVTQVGAYLDPIADKCLLSGVFLALAVGGFVPRWFVAVIFGRDLYIVAAVGFLLWLTSLRSFPPSVWGKASTLLQVLTATMWLAEDAVPSPPLGTASRAMLWPCAVFTVWSGLHYTWRGLQLARAH